MSKPETHSKSFRINPPEQLSRAVEDSVMESISGLPSPRVMHIRRRRSIIAATTLAAFSVILLVLFQNPSPKAFMNTDYVENRVYLPNHTSIWLTPVADQQGGK
jgi:hypothetical protein